MTTPACGYEIEVAKRSSLWSSIARPVLLFLLSGCAGLPDVSQRADDQSADDGAEHRLEAAEDQHWQRLQRDEGQRELHAVARAPHQAGDQRHESGDRPDDGPDLLEWDADG